MLLRTLQAIAVAVLILTPSVWLAHMQQAAQFTQAAKDRAAWCAVHPKQEAGPEQCYLYRGNP